MVKRRFSVQLSDGRSGNHHNLRRLTIQLTPAAASRAVPDPEVEVLGLAAATPTSPTCWLQIWHLGEQDGARLGLDDYEKRMRGKDGYPPAEPARNVLLAEIPGCVKETQIDQFEFLALGPIAAGTTTASAHVGWLTLALQGADEKPWNPAGKEPRIKLSHDGADDFVVLACKLENSPRAPLQPPARAPTFHCCNLSHAIGAMLAEDSPGLTVGFHVRLLRDDGTPAPANTNDGSFFKYGEWMARVFHSIGLTADGELTLGTTRFSSAQEMVDGTRKILDEVEKLIGSRPKIKRFFVVTHGDNNPKFFKESGGGIQVRDQKTWMTAANGLEDHLKALAPHFTKDVVYTLCACHVGAAPEHDWDFGELHPDMGAGSFADKARKILTDTCGLEDAAVWGHGCLGDALRNPVLRVFTRAGNADVTWLIAGKPQDARSAESLASLWLARFPQFKADSDPMFLEFLNLSIQNPIARVREIFGK